jgi:hypothetical protein
MATDWSGNGAMLLGAVAAIILLQISRCDIISSFRNFTEPNLFQVPALE